MTREERTALMEQLKKAEDERQAQYWYFTRCARAKPVSAEICREIHRLKQTLGIPS